MLAFESSRGRRTLVGMALGLSSLLVPALSWAQSPPPEPPPSEPPPRINLSGGSSMDLSTPPPPPPVARQYHQHEGFYVRVSAGLGTLLSASIDTNAVEFTSSGVTLDFDALIGGGPAPGFTLGGGVLGSLQLSGDWEAEGFGTTDSADLTTFIIGPFADGYPDPKHGLHFGGLLGLATVSFEDPGGSGSDALGVGGSAWAGYDVWVGPEFSVGGALKLTALRASNSDDDITVSAIGGTLSFSVLYN